MPGRSEARPGVSLAPEPPAAHHASLEVRDVGKRFGRTLALAGVSLDVRQGEVHALLGHNGSGKSTLVKIISGVVPADEGTVTINGRDGAPAQIGVVHQDLGLCPDATVVENCCMSGYRTTRFATIHWSAERRAVAQILDSLAADFAGETMVRDLSPANQAVVAIARALKSAPVGGALDLLVIDEATSRLRGRDADKVLATASMVARQGGGVLIVTHHMTEVLRAADRATVLANGRVAGVVDVADTSEEGLLELASGHQVVPPRPAGGASPLPGGVPGPASDRRAAGEPVLVASDIAGDRILSRAGITLAAGEIVGLTGAPGAGHEEIPYLIAGLPGRGRAEIVVSGRTLRHRGAGVGRRRGIGLVPADRLTQGVLPTASVRENLSPLVRRRHTRSRLTSNRRELSWAREVCRAFQVRPDEPEVPIGDLSGGNQQKVLLARVLEDEPAVLLLHEPTEGVDEMTRRALVDVVRQVAARGTAVLYVSSDIEEVAGCSDRVLVVRDGALVAELAGGPDMVDEIYAACYLARDAAPGA